MTTMHEIFSGYEARLATLAKSSNPFAAGVAWIDGQYVPIAEAKIPLLDEGFLRGDLTYDVPAVWDGRWFRFTNHLDRLEASCKKLRLTLPLPKHQIERILTDMVSQSGIKDAFVELIVTRGLTGVRGNKASDLKNKLYMFVKPYVWVMPPAVQRTGGSAVIARTVRRTPVGAMDPTVKNLQWGDFVRGMFEAADRNASYPFLLDGDGNLTEGAGFNILLVKDGVIYTPSRGVLEGVTRRSVFDIARKEGIEVKVDFVRGEMAYSSDEIFMATTAGGIMPITELDGRHVGNGSIGPITQKIWDAYWSMHWDPTFSSQIKYAQVSGGRAKL